MDATLLIANLILALASFSTAASIPFVLWKLKKLEEKVEQLDATLAEVLTPK